MSFIQFPFQFLDALFQVGIGKVCEQILAILAGDLCRAPVLPMHRVTIGQRENDGGGVGGNVFLCRALFLDTWFRRSIRVLFLARHGDHVRFGHIVTL